MKSVMSHQFSMIPSCSLERSTFDRSHGHKTTFDSGFLVPIFVDEALPGDTFNLHATLFARLATPIVPFMDNLFLETFYFSVPARLLWDNWKKINGEQINPNDSTDYLVPQAVTSLTSEIVALGPESIGDYFGIPTGISYNAGTGNTVNALPFRAYNLIYNEWFRDENLINSAPIYRGDGPDLMSDYPLRRRCKRHDYFTSCMPWPQKGPGVMLPLGTTAPVYGNGKGLLLSDTTATYALYANNGTLNPGLTLSSSHSIGTTLGNFPATSDHKMFGVTTATNGDSGLIADLTNASAATINSLRQAFQMQKMYERDARGGTRYTEIIRSHFGVVSPDSRQQRPEYLGGSSQRININPVQQTSATGTGTPQGNLAAFGVVTDTHGGFNHSFTEHCYIIGLANVRADLTYQAGLNKLWSRKKRFDFYWPSFAHLGEQAVLNEEIFKNGSSDDKLVFGYQERYAEYRYKPSLITGFMRSQSSAPLDVWHLSQHFTTLPTLGQTFIEENPPIQRVVAVTSEPQFIFDSYFRLKCARPMPTYSVPGLIDHF